MIFTQLAPLLRMQFYYYTAHTHWMFALRCNYSVFIYSRGDAVFPNCIDLAHAKTETLFYRL